MTLRHLTIIIIIVIASAGVSYSADVNLSAQNELRFGDGEQSARFPPHFRYFENYLELNGSIDKVRFYIRQVQRTPGEFGRKSSGLQSIDKLSVEYAGDPITVKAGDFYSVWGRGLLFGNQELRELDIDTKLTGVTATGSWENVDASVMYGVTADTSFYVTHETIPTPLESVQGAYFQFRLPFDIKAAAGHLNLEPNKNHPKLDRHGFELGQDFSGASYYLNYSSDRFLNPVDTVYDGFNPIRPRFYHAFFGSTSFFGNGWSAYFDYHHYRAFLNLMENRPLFPPGLTQPLMLIPPIGRPDRSMFLLDHVARTIRYDSNVGYQVEFSGKRWDWDFWGNWAHYSTLNKAGLGVSSDGVHNPYRSLVLKGEGSLGFGDKIALSMGAQYDQDSLSTTESSVFKRFAWGAGYEPTPFSEDFTLRTDAEVMSISERHPGRFRSYWEQYLSLGFGWQGQVSLNCQVTRTELTGSGDGTAWPKEWLFGGKAECWPSTELVMQLYGQHRLAIFYGYERGGESCAGGICHIVSPFKGIKLTLTSHF